MNHKRLIIFKSAAITVISAIFAIASFEAFSALIRNDMYVFWFFAFIAFAFSASSAFIGIRSIGFAVSWLLIPSILFFGGCLIFAIVAINSPPGSFDEGPGILFLFFYFALLIHILAAWCVALVLKSWRSLKFISWYLAIILVLSAIAWYTTEFLPEQKERARIEKMSIQYDYVNFNYPGMILKNEYPHRGGQGNTVTEYYTCPRAKTESYSGISISQKPFISDEEFQNIDSSYGMQPIDIKGISKAFLAKKILADKLLILHYRKIIIEIWIEGDCQISPVDIANTISQQ